MRLRQYMYATDVELVPILSHITHELHSSLENPSEVARQKGALHIIPTFWRDCLLSSFTGEASNALLVISSSASLWTLVRSRVSRRRSRWKKNSLRSANDREKLYSPAFLLLPPQQIACYALIASENGTVVLTENFQQTNRPPLSSSLCSSMTLLTQSSI